MVERVLGLIALSISAALLGAAGARVIQSNDANQPSERASGPRTREALNRNNQDMNRYFNEVAGRKPRIDNLLETVNGLDPRMDAFSQTQSGRSRTEAQAALAEGRTLAMSGLALESKLREDAGKEGLFAGAADEWMDGMFTAQEKRSLDSLQNDLGLGPAEEAWRRLRFQLWARKTRLDTLDAHARKQPDLPQGGASFRQAADEIMQSSDEAVRLLFADPPRHQRYLAWLDGAGRWLKR
jgi:hypothetical protein